MLKYILLGFLNFHPTSGYDLHDQMETSTAHFWNAKLSQIYVTLKKMEADGLVISEMEAQDDRPDKRIYTITEKGQAELQDWLDKPNTDIDQMKSKMLLRLFFAGMNDLDAVITELNLQKSLHEERLQYYQTTTKQVIDNGARTTPNGEHHRIFWEATRTFGERYETMVVEWLDEILATLSNLKEKEE